MNVATPALIVGLLYNKCWCVLPCYEMVISMIMQKAIKFMYPDQDYAYIILSLQTGIGYDN